MKKIADRSLISRIIIIAAFLSLSLCHWAFYFTGLLIAVSLVIAGNKKIFKKKIILIVIGAVYSLMVEYLNYRFLKSGISGAYLLTFVFGLTIGLFGEFKEGQMRKDTALILVVLWVEAIVEFSQGHYFKIFEVFGIYGIYGFMISRVMFLVSIIYIGTLMLIPRLFLSKRTSYILIADIIFALSIVNMFVLEFTGLPFMFGDIKLFAIAMSVIEKYQMSFKFMIRLIITVILIIIFNVVCFKTLDKSKPDFSFKKLVFYLVPSLMIVIVLFPTLNNGDVEAVLKFDGNRKNGFFLNFVLSVKPNLSKPANYSKDNIISFNDSKYLIDPEVKPNIIVIMNEAFCDLSVNGDLNSDVEVIPYIKKIMEEYPSGWLVSSVLGRNTCTSELEFLSGMPSLLSCQGADIYSSYINGSIPSVAKVMKELGYNAKGLHPYYKSGYFRKKSWPLLGLEDTLFLEELENVETYRGYASDEYTYGQIIDLVNDSQDPLFLMCVTMQNHGGYIDEANGLREYVYSPVSKTTELNNYLSLIHETDYQTKLLLEELEECGEETVVLFFGDHQPLLSVFFEEIYGDDNSDEVVYRKHLIPYFLWNNYGADFSLPEEISYNYLASVLLNELNISNSWFDYIYGLMDDYPVLSYYLVKDGNGFVSLEELAALSKEEDFILKPYENSIYYYLKDQ